MKWQPTFSDTHKTKTSQKVYNQTDACIAHFKMSTFVHSFISRHVLCIDPNEYGTVLDLKRYLVNSNVSFSIRFLKFLAELTLYTDTYPKSQDFANIFLSRPLCVVPQ